MPRTGRTCFWTIAIGLLAIVGCRGPYAPYVHPDFESRYKPEIRSVAILGDSGVRSRVIAKWRTKLFAELRYTSAVYVYRPSDSSVDAEKLLGKSSPEIGRLLEVDGEVDGLVRIVVEDCYAPDPDPYRDSPAFQLVFGTYPRINPAELRGSVQLLHARSGVVVWQANIDTSHRDPQARSTLDGTLGAASVLAAENWPFPLGPGQAPPHWKPGGGP